MVETWYFDTVDGFSLLFSMFGIGWVAFISFLTYYYTMQFDGSGAFFHMSSGLVAKMLETVQRFYEFVCQTIRCRFSFIWYPNIAYSVGVSMGNLVYGWAKLESQSI